MTETPDLTAEDIDRIYAEMPDEVLPPERRERMAELAKLALALEQPCPAAREQATPSSGEPIERQIAFAIADLTYAGKQLTPGHINALVPYVMRVVTPALAAREAEVRREADRWHAEADRAHEALDRVRELCDPRKKPWYVGRDGILEALSDSLPDPEGGA